MYRKQGEINMEKKMEEKVKREYFTKVPCRTLENLAKLRVSTNEFRTIMVVVRKTYGFHKDKDRISLSQFQKLTGLDRKRQVCALRSLVNKGILLKESSYIRTYEINRKFYEWMVSGQPLSMLQEDKKKLVAFKEKLVADAGQILVAGSPHTIDNLVDILQRNEDFQDFIIDDTCRPDISSEQVSAMDAMAVANAPAERQL